jgi:hypothetical protein
MAELGRRWRRVDGAGTQSVGEGIMSGVPKALVPHLGRDDGGGECSVARRLRDWIQILVGVTPEDHPLRPSILDRKTEIVKLDVKRIITCKLFDRN